ncbi:MAG TPA: isoleucine--tRNA ligase [bacterium]|nr:isoleucine--tRNA ligase [bacterium]HPN35229.1 isoleucine--tRNA ligase [bacterium]
MFKELPEKLNFPEIEKKVLHFWEQEQIFQRSVQERDPQKPFVFYEGPPTANGRPGIHHVISRTVKDAVCRLKTMQGYRVARKAGWDTHGLPVEIEVEKKLNLDGKDQVIEYGIDRFCRQCQESVWSYKQDWDDLTRRIGFWVDLDHPYITYTNDYIETVWWILKEVWNKGLLYQGHKILPYCPRCQTPLSSHEVSLGYEEVKDPSIYVKAAVRGQENTYFLVWTTTPWTLISNVALALHPETTYVKVRHQDQLLILAQARLTVLDGPYEVVEQYAGKDLAGWEYEPFYSFVKPDKKAHYTVLGDFVTTTDGSGIVHIAPAFGEDDYQLGLKYDLPFLQPVDKAGAFTAEVTPWAGQFVKDADKSIIIDLKKRGVLNRSEPYLHSYPHCWRCKSPLLYYGRKSWYIKTTAIKDRLIANNKKIAWYPHEVGEGRFGEWLENNIDWSLSRDRFWGTPLPVWRCSACDHQRCIGSVQELREKSGQPLADLDLHKSYVDAIKLPCEKCGAEMIRVPEVIDCWFDSGSMPYAQWHYPFENQETFAKNFPADFISEGVDQTRGWFYSLLVIGTLLFDEPAFKSCVSLELILDKEGQKMSKTRGNAVDPVKFLDQQGADALRWYLLTVSPPWLPTRFDPEGVVEVVRKFLGTLVNTYSFFALYANIDRFTYKTGERIPVEQRSELDRWLCSALKGLTEKVNENLQRYDLTKAGRSLNSFVLDDLSNWYVRRSRRRFWKAEMGQDKCSAYQTLWECLVVVSRLMAPLAPFISEEIFRNLTNGQPDQPISVHLAAYPSAGDPLLDYRDEKLEARMDLVRRVVSLGRSLRNEAAIKTRQPLAGIYIVAPTQKRRDLIRGMESLVLEELNVKQIKFVEQESELVSKKAEPVFKNLGPKFGKVVNRAAEAIRAFTDEEIQRLLDAGHRSLVVDGHEYRIEATDITVQTENRAGLLAATEGDLTVAVETLLTEELTYEGLAREFVNRVQNMRKEAKFEVTDRIHIWLTASAPFLQAVERMRDYVSNETLCESLRYNETGGTHQKEWKIDEESISVGIARI